MNFGGFGDELGFIYDRFGPQHLDDRLPSQHIYEGRFRDCFGISTQVISLTSNESMEKDLILLSTSTC